MSLDFTDTAQRTDEETQLIKEILETVMPAECEFLGEDAVTAISNGVPFESIAGGSHMNFAELVSLLTLVAGISQLAIFALVEAKKLWFSSSEQLMMESKKLVLQKILEHPELKDLADLITEDEVILERILATILEKSEKLKQL